MRPLPRAAPPARPVAATAPRSLAARAAAAVAAALLAVAPMSAPMPAAAARALVAAAPLAAFAATPSLGGDDPVPPFALKGAVAKKYSIDATEPGSSRVVSRRAGVTAAACAAAESGPRGGEVAAALAGPTVADDPPTSCGRAEADGGSLPAACANACAAACDGAVAARAASVKSITGFMLSPDAARRGARDCARACGAECTRPSTSAAVSYPFSVNVRTAR